MKKTISTLLVLIALCLSTNVYGQSIDERIATAMNNSQWRELRELYLSSGQDLQTPFLHPLSKFFIHYFYNQSDSAMHYGSILLNNHQAELGSSLSTTIYMMSDVFTRLGNYQAAADLMHQINEAMEKAGWTVEPIYVAFEKQNRAIASAGGFSFSKPDRDIKIPFRFLRDSRKDPGMLYVPVEMNGVKQEVTYDTGAGGNIMTLETASKVGARVLDFEGMEVKGMQTVSSQFAIVDSIKLGDIVYRNVPFYIADFSTDNKEANAKLKEINLHCILGIPTMAPLQEIQFDFANRCLIIPAKQSDKPNFAPNVHFTASNILALAIYDKKTKQAIDANLDTGAAMSDLTARYYARNQALFDGIVPNDSVRVAGLGGVYVNKVFKHHWEYEVGNTKNLADTVNVSVPKATDNPENAGYDCTFGLPSLARHDLLIINFKDMWVSLSPLE